MVLYLRGVFYAYKYIWINISLFYQTLMVIINNKIGGGEIIRLIENLFGTYKGDFGFAKGEIYIG